MIGMPGMKFTMTVSAYDCTGCGSCVNVYPGKKGEKALVMGNMEENAEMCMRDRSNSIAISSLLILAALCCFGAGVGIAGTNSLSSDHVIDYTFEDHTAEDSSQMCIRDRLIEVNLPV